MLQYLPNLSPSELGLFALLILTTLSSVGLVMIWAGLGRWHWFFRTIVAVAVIAAFLLLPARELVVLFSAQSVCTILPLLVLRTFQRRISVADTREAGTTNPSRTQVFLRDLFLLTVIAAAFLAVLTQVPRRIWFMGVLLAPIGLGAAVSTLAGLWIALGCSRWGRRLVVLSLFLLAALIALFVGPLWVRLVLFCVFSSAPMIALLLGLARTADFLEGETARSSSGKRLATAGVVLWSLLILFPPSFAFYTLSTARPIPKAPSLAGPNHYADLILAAKAFAKFPPSIDTSPLDSIRSFVNEHRSALDRAHAVLQQSCQASIRYDVTDVTDLLYDLMEARRMAYALDVEAVLAQREGRTNDAIRVALEEYRLGNALSHGGALGRWNAGRSIEGIGAARITRLRNSLSADECRQLINALQKIETEREPLEEVFAREAAWADRSYEWHDRLGWHVSRVAALFAISHVHLSNTWQQVRTEALLGTLALCGYRREHDQFPAALSDLVPEYLPTVPQDPFSGKPLVYHRTATGYLLYSIGPDGKDDGGRRVAPGTTAPGDYVLEDLTIRQNYSANPTSTAGEFTPSPTEPGSKKGGTAGQ